MVLKFRQVPRPPINDRTIIDTAAWDDNGPRNIVGTCVHRMENGLDPTDTWFRTDAAHIEDKLALTDFGIGGVLDQGLGLDGVIYQWNDPLGPRSPYANGWSKEEGPDIEENGQPFIDSYGSFDAGRKAINRDLVSLELSGQYDTDVSEAQFERCAGS
jgi:hypothetical protein